MKPPTPASILHIDNTCQQTLNLIVIPNSQQRKILDTSCTDKLIAW